MAGNRSEMSAISLYTYSNLILTGMRLLLFHKISIGREMHHLYIFGTLARQLGSRSQIMDIAS